jgi:hypothetical protein
MGQHQYLREKYLRDYAQGTCSKREPTAITGTARQPASEGDLSRSNYTQSCSGSINIPSRTSRVAGVQHGVGAAAGRKE